MARNCDELADHGWRYDAGQLLWRNDTRLSLGTFLPAWKGLETQLLPVSATTAPRQQWQLLTVGRDYSCPNAGLYGLCF